jgi:fructosamine-3-kinase
VRSRAGRRAVPAKLNEARFVESFAAEADGLIALGAAGMRVPRPIAVGSAEGSAFLVLEFLALGAGSDAAHREFGRRLARQHGHRGPHFGWARDNFIGLTPQANAPCASWVEFWQTRRLAPQLALARANGYEGRLQSLGGQVVNAVPRLLAAHDAAPALLHGICGPATPRSCATARRWFRSCRLPWRPEPISR